MADMETNRDEFEGGEVSLHELGECLRKARLEKAIELELVAQETKIRVPFLEAIENGDYSGFHSMVYARGFVKTYLTYLGRKDMWSSFETILVSEKKTRGEIPVLGNFTPPARGFRKGSRFWIIGLLLIVILSSVYYLWTQKELIREEIAQNREKQASRELNVVNSAVASGDDRVAMVLSGDNSVAADISQALSSDVVSSGDVLPEALKVVSVVAESPKTDEQKAEVVAKDEGKLVIRTSGKCWIGIKRGSQVLYQGTMKKGQTRTFKVMAATRVTYGNAGVVSVRWNGRDLGRPSGSGGVARYVYEPDGKMRKVK